MKKARWLLAILSTLVVTTVLVGAQGKLDGFYASSERFGYAGTVSVYDTWADANSGKHARCSEQVWPQRDGAIFAVKNAPDYYFDSSAILTNWFANNGVSPSDTNVGFFQLYDLSADAWQNQKASWSRDRNTFTISAKGRDATYGDVEPLDYARMWNACAPTGGSESTSGTFVRYEYVFTATGLNGVQSPSGFITNTTNASDYSGYFRGIFRNESTTSRASNGYYVFDIQFNGTSWAALNNYGWGGPTLPDEFGGRR